MFIPFVGDNPQKHVDIIFKLNFGKNEMFMCKLVSLPIMNVFVGTKFNRHVIISNVAC